MEAGERLMALTTTRLGRAGRWRVIATSAIAISTFQIICVADAMSQVKAPSKSQLRGKAQPGDNQADELNAKWLSEHNQRNAEVQQSTAAAAKDAPSSPGPEDQRLSNMPSMAAPVVGGARAVVAGSVKLVKASNPTAAFTSVPGGAIVPAYKELTQAFAGFAPNGGKIEIAQGKTADGWSRLLYASVGEGKNRQTFWWFAPFDQPDGWFDDSGKRLGGTMLSDPKPDSRVSSPFGTRRYYGRASGGGFHNGIDYEGKTGEPIYAAADGVINHQGWYFNYGRTVKISHAESFETLYAHMSRFADGVGPGSQVRKGDLIGYIGSSGRSSGPHLHFSTIVNGQFVDPAPYISPNGSGQLDPNTLVAFRKWQQDVKAVVDAERAKSDRRRWWSRGSDEGTNQSLNRL
jgi:murein DD-endopeptidase MepM/ murein hydrolase activator NlpD